LYRHAARILGADDADVEDVVQQAFLAALAGGANFDGRSTVATWLFGITTRRALDAARSRWRRQRWNRVAEGFGWTHLSAPAPDRGMELRSEAEAMLAGLTPEQRLVFLLHDVEGHTFAEISGVTGIGISSLHARLASARKKLDRLAAERGQRIERGEDDR
jgi:RNA polymerase sigma-70 factor (ECF subfamily)